MAKPIAHPVKAGPKRRRSLFHRLARALSYQKKTPLSMPPAQRLKALRHGFRSSMYTFYDFEQHDPRDYLPDTVYREAANINGKVCQNVLRDKLFFSKLLESTFRVPEVFALVDHGQFYPLGEKKTLPEILEAHGGLVLKPTDGQQGIGIFSVVERQGALWINGQPGTLAALEKQVARLNGYLVTERIAQDGYARDIFPGSANSIRVVTMQDPDDNHRPFIAVAFHRFGSKTTGPVDNVSRGGLMAHIGPDGVMGSAIKFPHETGGRLFWCAQHPDTGVAIEGQAVPRWETLQQQLLKLVSAFPLFRHVGWDVIVAQDSFWLVEGNPAPSPVGQVFHPYLLDPKIRRFFEHYGVI